MNRRQFHHTSTRLLAAMVAMAYGQAHALSLADLTDGEASQGLKTALEKGAQAAISLLGRKDGFLGNDKVRIPLPGFLDDAAKLLKTFGQGKRVDELVTAMNRAAESAVPMAKDLLMDAVRTMSVTDAKNILTGGDTSVTEFFATRTREPLTVKFLPVVTTAIGSNREVTRDGAVASLVPSRDPRALASAIRELVADPKRREQLGRAAQHEQRSRYTMTRMLESYLEEYDRLLARGATLAVGR